MFSCCFEELLSCICSHRDSQAPPSDVTAVQHTCNHGVRVLVFAHSFVSTGVWDNAKIVILLDHHTRSTTSELDGSACNKLSWQHRLMSQSDNRPLHIFFNFSLCLCIRGYTEYLGTFNHCISIFCSHTIVAQSRCWGAERVDETETHLFNGPIFLS